MKNNLKQIRKSKNLLQTRVAIDLNTTQETISSYETGRVFPSPDMLIALADYYNTSIDYLLCRTSYNMPIDQVKPANISDQDFMILNKIKTLSICDRAKIEGYIDGLNENRNGQIRSTDLNTREKTQ